MSNNELGIFGGTFDPIHNGHIQSVLTTAKHLAISKVLLVPAHIPPHKNNVIANSQHRLKMAEMVCQHQPLFSCDARELKRDLPSYTVDTLKEISQSYPKQTLYLFIGMDSLLNFTTWHQWQTILTLCHVVVSSRPSYSNEQMNQATKQLLAQHQVTTVDRLKQTPSGKIYIYQQADFSVSSTNIRQKLQQKSERLNDLPEYISQYINVHQLYRK